MRTAILALVALVLLQAVPYGHGHANPPVTAEPAWDGAATRELVRRACFDCHSNETQWPWYSNIAPVSWLVVRDVQSGRRELNFSEWDRRRGETSEATEAVAEGSMPPSYYTLINRSAHLSSQERARLIDGLRATFGAGEGD